VHDIGLYLLKNEQGEIGFKVLVGGGLGRTPVIGQVICEYLPWQHLLTYLDAIMRVYNMEGRRDNKYKARIKILVKELGIDAFREKVEAQWQFSKGNQATLTEEEVARCKSFFSTQDFEQLPDEDETINAALQSDLLFKNWVDRNVDPHKQNGYCIVSLCIKDTGVAPGDVTDRQMEFVADLAERYSFSELRITHEQNLTLADVRIKDLYDIYKACKREFGDSLPWASE
jgi:sulfite reductase (NADPH) hemoprotein beta-component